MKAGIITDIKEITYTHANTCMPFPPSEVSENKLIWKLSYICDHTLDIKYKLSEKTFIGAISLNADCKTIKKIEILIDNKLSGIYHQAPDNSDDILISLAEETDNFTLRIYPATTSSVFPGFYDIVLENIEILGIISNDEPLIYPSPKKLVFAKDILKIKNITTHSNSPDELYAKAYLEEELGLSKNNTDGVDIIIEKTDSPDYADERYTIFSSEDEIRIKGATRLTLLYGANSIIQAVSPEGTIRKFDLDDTPTQKIRGFHMGLPQKENFEFARRLFRYVLLPLKYNMIIVEFAGGMRFTTRPEISEAWVKGCENGRNGIQPPFPHAKMGAEGHLLEKEDVKEFVGYIKDSGFNFVPEIQSLGHVQYITYTYPEIAEVPPTGTEDYYHHSYCPSNEKSYEIIFDIIDEIVEVSSPDEYIHIGHDEVYEMGLCEKCAGKNSADLLAYHINRVYDYIAKKGLKVMMWADMLHPRKVAQESTGDALFKIPKDILLLDFIWYFFPDGEIEDDLSDNGFNIIIGNLYSSHFKKYNKRIAKKDIIGGQLSTWVGANEDLYAFHGKFYDAMYLSQMLVNTEDYDERNRETYNKIIFEYLQKSMRDKIRGTKGAFSEKTILPEGSDKEIPADLKEFTNAVILSDEEIIINDFADKIEFNHATINHARRIPWENGFIIGEYTINYDNGSKEIIKIEYGKNILSYKSVCGMPQTESVYRHMGYEGTWNIDPVISGKNAYAETISTFIFPYDNPHPDMKIKSISYKRNEDEFLTLMLSSIKLFKEVN